MVYGAKRGKESYDSLITIFMKNSKIALFDYSNDNSYSFKELDYFINSAKDEVYEDYFMAIDRIKNDLINKKSYRWRRVGFCKKDGIKIKLYSALADQPWFKYFIDDLIIGNIFLKERNKIKNDNL